MFRVLVTTDSVYISRGDVDIVDVTFGPSLFLDDVMLG